jgi:hypothetical protein
MGKRGLRPGIGIQLFWAAQDQLPCLGTDASAGALGTVIVIVRERMPGNG